MKEKKELIYLFISILTLIIMGLGASFAFFTASTREKNKEDMVANAANIKVNLSVKALYNGKEILPTNDEDIDKAYANKCVDSLGNGACIAYTIELANNGSPQEGYLSLNFTSETLENLKFILIDNNDNDKKIIDSKLALKGEIKVDDVIKMSTNDTKKYTLIIWLSNIKESEQDKEQGGIFNALISYSSVSGSRISGSMNDTIKVGD